MSNITYLIDQSYDSTEDLSSWDIITGNSDRISVVGSDLVIGADIDSNDFAILVWKNLIPFSETSLYEWSAVSRMTNKRQRGFAIGFIGYASDGVTIIPANSLRATPVGLDSSVIGTCTHWHFFEYLSFYSQLVADGYVENSYAVNYGQPFVTDAERQLLGGEDYFDPINLVTIKHRLGTTPVLYNSTMGVSTPDGDSFPKGDGTPSLVRQGVKFIKPVIMANFASNLSFPSHVPSSRLLQYFRLKETAYLIGSSTGTSTYTVTTPLPTITLETSGVAYFQVTVDISNWSDGIIYYDYITSTGVTAKASSFINTVGGFARISGYVTLAPYTPHPSPPVPYFNIEFRTGTEAGPVVAISPTVYVAQKDDYEFSVLTQAASGGLVPIVVTFNAYRLAPGAVIDWYLSGVTLEDITIGGNSLSGTITVGTNGVGAKVIYVKETVLQYKPLANMWFMLQSEHTPLPPPGISFTGTPYTETYPPAIGGSTTYGLELYDSAGNKSLSLVNRAALVVQEGAVNVTITLTSPTSQTNYVDVSIAGLIDNGDWVVLIANPLGTKTQQTWVKIFSGYFRVYYHRDIAYGTASNTVTVAYQVIML